MRKAMLVTVLLLLLAGTAAADSQFGMNALGVTHTPTHVRAWTMGRLTVALDDSLRLSLSNPALAGGFRRVSMNALYMADRRTANDTQGEVTFSTSGFPLFEFLIPFGSRFAVGFGYVEENDLGSARARLTFDAGDEVAAPHTRFFERRGAVFRVPASLSFRFFRDVRFGFRLDSYFANIEEDYYLDFDDSSILDTRERLLVGGSGTGGAAGLVVPLGPIGHAGLFYAASASLDGTREREGASGAGSSEAVEIGLPERLGGGVSVNIGNAWTVGGEVVRSSWADVDDTLSALGGYQDVVAWAVGLERMPSIDDPWYVRYPIRAGFRSDPLHYRVTAEEEIRRWMFMLGSGFRFGEGRGLCDFGIEYGVIGDQDTVGLEESYIRFLVGITGQEPWRKRKSYIE